MKRFIFKYPEGSGKPDKKVLIPENWKECNVETFVNISIKKDKSWRLECEPVELCAMLTGIPYDYIWASNERELIQESLKFFADGEGIKWDKLRKKKYITLDGKRYKVPTDLTQEAYGRYLMAIKVLTETPEHEQIKVIPFLVALYLQPQIHKEPNINRVDEVEKMVLKAPILEVYPIASFFFEKLIALQTFGIEHYHASPRSPRTQRIKRPLI